LFGAFIKDELTWGDRGQWHLVAGVRYDDFEDEGEDLLRGLSDGGPFLAEGQPDRFLNAVAQRTAPPRSSKSAPAPEADPPKTNPPEAPTERGAQEPEAARSPLQRLVDRFR